MAAATPTTDHATALTPDTNDSEKLTAIHLTTTMTLKPATEVLVTCNTKIKVELLEGGVLYLNSPATFTAPGEARLSPSVLDPEFALGWDTLPDELTMMVLGHNLIEEDKRIALDKDKGHFSLSSELHRHLLMVARDVFYKENEFFIDCLGRSLRFPPRSSRHLIRSITARVRFGGVGMYDIRGIARAGVSNLRDIVIEFGWSDSKYRNELRDNTPFPASTKTQIMCSGKGTIRQPDAQKVGLDVEKLKGHAKRHITLVRPRAAGEAKAGVE
jgi:hypothetical protein